jgi:3-oxoacyl-[acyl-carrier protein] reductase
MKIDLQGKTALVTASTGGIGLEIARALAGAGAKVVLNGRTRTSVEKGIADVRAGLPGAELLALVADNGTAAGCAATIAQLPEVDILVNNLGIYEPIEFFDLGDDAWQKLFDVNVMSGVRLCRHYLRGMLKRGHGRVVFIASEAAVLPAPEMTHYSAFKTLLLGLSRSLAELTRNTAVTVNTVLPGSTRTDGVEKFIQDVYPGMPYADAERRFMKEHRPTSLIGRLINPTEIADVVTFICSERASAVNGAPIRVEGGLIPTVF